MVKNLMVTFYVFSMQTIKNASPGWDCRLQTAGYRSWSQEGILMWLAPVQSPVLSLCLTMGSTGQGRLAISPCVHFSPRNRDCDHKWSHYSRSSLTKLQIEVVSAEDGELAMTIPNFPLPPNTKQLKWRKNIRKRKKLAKGWTEEREC